jgi:hypothetical protein
VQFRQNRPWEPMHPNRIIVRPAQKNVGRDGAPVQRVQEMLGTRLNQPAIPNQVKRFVSDRLEPAFTGSAGFRARQLLHHVLP